MVSLLTISIAGQGFNAAGTVLNGFDLGPNYIGPVSGMVAGVSTTSSLMAPYIVGLLTPHVRGNLPIPHLVQKIIQHFKLSIYRHTYRNGVEYFG